MDKLLIAPSIFPISIAFAVPIACEAVPIAIPFAIGSWILNNLHTFSAIIFPVIPVIITIGTVRLSNPPNSFDIPIAIAAVTDFGSKVIYITWENENMIQNSKTLIILVNTPEIIPKMIALIFFFNNFICS